jgi:hypothetical protein
MRYSAKTGSPNFGSVRFSHHAYLTPPSPDNHFFLNLSLTTVGVGLELIAHETSANYSHVLPINIRWIFASGISLFLASLGVVHLIQHGTMHILLRTAPQRGTSLLTSPDPI